jgi:plastocyanin
VSPKVGLLGLLFLYQSFAWSDVSLRVVDAQGQPVPNAVVSFPINVFPDDQLALSANDPASSVVMDQVDKQFSPHVLLVKPGQQVVFPNSDQVRHHVYSFSKPNDFEIKLYSGDQADPVRFDYPGIVVLGCNIHDQMVGYLYIVEGEVARISDAQGRVHFSGNLVMGTQPLQVTLWHSRLSSSKVERVTQILGAQNEEGVWQVVLDLLPEVSRESRKFKPRFQ